MAVDIQFNADQALSKLGELVAKHGPEAVDLAAQVVRVNALNTLSGVIGYGALAGLTFAALRFALARAKEHQSRDAYDDLPKVGWGFAIAASGVGATGFAWAAAASALNIWAWVALFNPKLALAHQVLAKFAGI